MASRKVWDSGAWVDLSGGVPFGNFYNQTASNWVANQMVCVPYRLKTPVLIDKLGTRIFTSAGNLDLGIYTDTSGSPDDLLVSIGSTASPGTGFRTFSVTETLVPAGLIWLAMAASSATLAIYSIVHSSGAAGFGDTVASAEIDARIRNSAFPLADPSEATAATTGFMPVIWADHS